MDFNNFEISDTLILSGVLNVIPYHVFWKDKQLIFRGCNFHFANQFGLKDPKEIIGKNDEYFPWSSALRKKYKTDDLSVINTGHSLLNIEEDQIQSNGEMKTLLVNKVPIKNKQNEIVGILGAYTDISHLKKIELSLRKEKEKAEAANKAKEEFLYNMRHDIRTPFSGIIGMAGLLKQQESDEKKINYINNILQSSDEVLNYMNTILEFSQIEEGSIPIVSNPVFIKDLVDQCIRIFASSLEEKNISLSFVYDSHLQQSYCSDEFRLKRIIINLLGNAVKFTNRGGKIAITISLVPHPLKEIISLSIKDNGIGIPKNKHNVIFEKFARLSSSYKSPHKGSGLGLHCVKMLVDDLGGEIFIESVEGKGSTFSFHIPLEKTSTDFSKENNLNISSQKNCQKTMLTTDPRVLLVEDSEIVQQVVRNMLENSSCSVFVADSGEGAVDICQKMNFDLVLMDIGLPGIDGFSAVEKIRTLPDFHSVPIVALTAHRIKDIGKKSFLCGMNEVISKPLSVESLEGLLENYFEIKK